LSRWKKRKWEALRLSRKNKTLAGKTIKAIVFIKLQRNYGREKEENTEKVFPWIMKILCWRKTLSPFTLDAFGAFEKVAEGKVAERKMCINFG
jgi:hypothetical protein